MVRERCAQVKVSEKLAEDCSSPSGCCGSSKPTSSALNNIETCCGSSQPALCGDENTVCSGGKEETTLPEWVCGHVQSAIGPVPQVSTEWSRNDRWGQIKARISSFRMRYTVPPGLYSVGNPDEHADILVSANYKLSFDVLRRELKGMNAWILVLDTKGINVWCAAGKGTFGTHELIQRIHQTKLEQVVAHRRLIVPQLGAPGVNAAQVKKQTGFRVRFGPVRAADIPAYVKTNYTATREMRTVTFPLKDRLVLTPMEILPMLKKFPVYALIILIAFGLQPAGILFRDAWDGGWLLLLLGLLSVVAGAFLTPVLLPFLPFRSFALKGGLVGIVILAMIQVSGLLSGMDARVLAMTALLFPLATSYIALQFTGSTTFTGISGVRKELRVGIPVYIAGSVVSAGLLMFYKLSEWGVL